MVVVYRVDGSDRLTDWNEDFAAFGRDNGLAVGDDLRGTRLWTHMSDGEDVWTQRWLLQRVRERSVPLRFRYRCDSPSHYRLFEMEMEALEESRVEYRSTLLSIRPFRRLEDDGATRVVICAWCKRVRSPVGWIELEDATLALDSSGSRVQTALSHGICANCSGELRRSGELAV